MKMTPTFCHSERSEESLSCGKRPFASLRVTALVAACLIPACAHAVKTERWELNSPADFMRGKLQRLTVSSDGQLHLGYGSTSLGELAKEVWCSAVGRDGTIYFGTGSPANVYAIGKNGQITKMIETEAIAVTALAIDSRGNLYAATMPEGKIFKDTHTKEKSGNPGAEFCRLSAPYVWALVVDKQDRLFAGTGPDGKVYRIEPDGKAEEWFAAEESNILSLALDADGSLLAGGSDRGLLYRITEKGKGVVLYEFSEDEVKSILVSGRDVYVGANKQKIRRPRLPGPRRPSAAEFEDLTQRLSSQFGGRVSAETVERGRETPMAARLTNLLQGALYLRNTDGRVDQLANWDSEAILNMGLDAEGGVITAMAGAGRVYRVVGNQHWELLFDFDEQQALTLAIRDGRLAFVGTGNVGTGYLVDAKKANDGEFTSEVRDCRFLTTWGNLSWKGTGTVTVATRTGNTALPDSTWSNWSEPVRTSPSKVSSPRGRFIQVRAQLANHSVPELDSLSLYYQMQNQKPDISTLDIGDGRKPATEKPKREPGTESKPDSTDSGGLESALAAATRQAGERKTDDFRPKPASTIKKISWRTTDKDGDTLVYRLYYQAQGDEFWVPVPLEKPLKTTDYSWETESIPDGWYRLKLVASDEESNSAGEALTDEKIGDPVKVDNTRPQVLQLSFDVGKSVLTGIARDALSLIRFLEYSVDGGDWKFFAPKDGVFDDREETFEVKLNPLPAGPHYIAVRATDEDGNVGVEKLSVRTK